MSTVRLCCSDGEILEIENQDAIELCKLIKDMIENNGIEDDIPIANVDKPMMTRVVEFVNKYKEAPFTPIEKPLPSTDMTQLGLDEWYVNFVNVDQQTLFDLVLAANYLDCAPLLELTGAKVASHIKGKSIQEVRQYFKITNDFSPEEEELVLQENQWAEESF